MVVKINSNESQDKNGTKKENIYIKLLDFRDIPLPKMDNELYLILYSLNRDIAEFYTLHKFTSHLPKKELHIELLRKSMNIHRNFAFLFLNTKSQMIFLSPEHFNRAEKLLFKKEKNPNWIRHTYKLCRVISNYKMALYKEGYLPRLGEHSLLDNI